MKLTMPGAELPESAPAQAFLFANDELREATEAAERLGQYTAGRLRQQDPKKYECIIELRGLDWGQKRIADFLGLHHRTIAAVDDAEPEAIDTVRQRLIKKLRRAGTLQVDRLTEHPDLVPIQFAGQTAVQLLGHAELMDGRATTRVEHTGRIDIFADWEEIIEKQLQPGDVIELDAGMGLAGGKNFPIGTALADRDIDVESEDRRSASLHATKDDTAFDTIRATDPAFPPPARPPSGSVDSERLDKAEPAGAGGVSLPTHPPKSQIHNSPRKFSDDKASNPS